MLKIIIGGLFIFYAFYCQSQNNESLELWNLRMEQDAVESHQFRKLTNYSDSTFPTSTGLLDKNDTLKYAGGQIFRTCEVSNKRLHGKYIIFYPMGTKFCERKYKQGYQSDTTIYYDQNGLVIEREIWVTDLKLEKEFFSKEGTVKKKYVFKYSTRLQDTHDLPSFSEKRYYYNYSGKKINKEEYYKLYGDDNKK